MCRELSLPPFLLPAGPTAPAPSIAKSRLFHTSMNRLQQPLYSAHFRSPFGSADSKGFSAPIFSPQLLYPQPLHTPSASIVNKGLITPLDSALPENPLVTPLESALPKTLGGPSEPGSRIPPPLFPLSQLPTLRSPPHFSNSRWLSTHLDSHCLPNESKMVRA
jgi:hypothetical protein